MSAKVISGGNLYILPTYDQPAMSSITCSNLSFISSIAKQRPRLFPIKASSGWSRARAKTSRATINAFYVLTQTKETFYETLGISESGTLSDIKKAYKTLARKYHPDASPPDRTEEYTKKFIMVQEAYETLSDPQTRALYDLDLSRGMNLAFSSRRSRYGERSVQEEEWKTRWQSQLNELIQRNLNRDSRGKVSWGTQMRRKRNSIFDLGF